MFRHSPYRSEHIIAQESIMRNSDKLLGQILTIILAGILAFFCIIAFGLGAEGATVETTFGRKYPPSVAALVKLKRAVTYPDGHKMPQWRTIKVQRNLNNAYRKNRNCPGISVDIMSVGYYSRRQQHGLAMVYARKAINRAYACHEAQWRRSHQ